MIDFFLYSKTSQIKMGNQGKLIQAESIAQVKTLMSPAFLKKIQILRTEKTQYSKQLIKWLQ